MFKAGDKVTGITYTDAGREQIRGTVVLRTDDPDEYIQDYVIRQADGVVVYCDEQEVYADRGQILKTE